jgi:hypothetical protein
VSPTVVAQPVGDHVVAACATTEVAARPSSRARSMRAFSTHPRLVPYQRLLVLVVLSNVVVGARGMGRGDWRIDDGSALAAFSALALVNVAVAVGVRQQPVLNVVYGLVGRGSARWPRWLRWSLSKVHHIGGIHAGAAIGASFWLCAFTVAAFVTDARHPGSVAATTLVLSAALVVVVLTVTVCAAPVVRARAHNVFESSHRWGGWTSIAVFWALTVQLAVHGRGTEPAAVAVATDWHVWVLALVTMWVAWPWLRLRRVPVTVVRPSSHVAIVELDYGVRPAFSAAIGISRSPLREWHAFATISSPDRPGFRLVISRAGDWTGRFIDDPPSHVWVRGVPVVAPMAMAAQLYQRVIYVVTGSGIGPLLGQILANRIPGLLVWSTRAPRPTYGDALVDEVEAAQPEAVIWDTDALGKPNLTELAVAAMQDFDAEAVFVVSNKKTTLRLVHDLESRGIPAFGPIWDS